MFSLEKKWLLLIWLLIIICFFNYNNTFTTCSNSNIKDKFSNSENKNSNLIKVYNFNTSWCGYSVRFQPEWEKFENEIKLINNLSIQAIDIKCDNINNKQMCNDYEIPGFPTIIIEKDGKKINYNGPRTANAIIETIKNL
jgi:thiol-disulfide isomerase/thioredoxin